MLIYLDQNKWIELAQMAHGKDSSARAKRILRELAAAVDGQSATLPLSSFHYIETSRISNVGRRVRLGEVMWRFSQGSTLLAYQAVVRHELEVALSKHFPQIVPSDIKFVGRGHTHAFALPPLQGTLAHFEGEFERSLLAGSRLLGVGPPSWQNTIYRENFRNHLATLFERQKTVPKEMRENWHYAMSMVDILNPINDVLCKHALPFDALGTLGEEKLKQVIDDMPTRRVDLHLHRQVLRNATYRAKSTDLEDWGSLALATCYCDVVVCEKHMADMLRRDRFRTVSRVETNLEQIFAKVRGV